jgi:rhodanese-related sulfurtransferase
MQPFFDDDIDVATAAKMLDEGAFLLDVRTDDEWSAGRIPKASHIELQTIPTRLDEVPTNRPVVVICKVGGRSAQATAFLKGNGINAYNVAGGMMAWQEEGYEMTSNTGETPTVL